jgi:hypothetical protein
MKPGTLDVFAVGQDGSLQHWGYPKGFGVNWPYPESLGGNLAAGLSAVSWRPGRIDVFGIGTDSTLQHWGYQDGKGGGPESLGGLLQQGSVSAVSWGPGRLDIFAIGLINGDVRYWSYQG